MEREPNTEYILSLSYGKDSLACLAAIEKLGWPLDRIVTAEVWATDDIPADLPPMMEFKKKADAIIKDRWGIEVEHICATTIYKNDPGCNTFEKGFYHELPDGKFTGTVKGFPMQRHPWCNKLKMEALKQVEKAGCISYVGIAADEPNRFHNLTEIKKSPLVEAGWTEAMCRKWCEENGLLSPIYTTATRGGCWFCHNQGVGQLRLLRKNYPEYWKLMLKWDLDSPVTFHPDGHTVHDFDKRFQMEDEGFINPNERFRWAMLDEEPNFRMF